MLTEYESKLRDVGGGERARKYSRRVSESEKSREKREKTLYCGGKKKNIILLEGSQASPIWPSDKSEVNKSELKT
jgi:hypothetical protein